MELQNSTSASLAQPLIRCSASSMAACTRAAWQRSNSPRRRLRGCSIRQACGLGTQPFFVSLEQFRFLIERVGQRQLGPQQLVLNAQSLPQTARGRRPVGRLQLDLLLQQGLQLPSQIGQFA